MQNPPNMNNNRLVGVGGEVGSGRGVVIVVGGGVGGVIQERNIPGSSCHLSL